MAIVPLAANTVALATELKVHPERAAIAVLLSTLFALFYIPFMAYIFIY
jgi:malate permease and related proteins